MTNWMRVCLRTMFAYPRMGPVRRAAAGAQRRRAHTGTKTESARCRCRNRDRGRCRFGVGTVTVAGAGSVPGRGRCRGRGRIGTATPLPLCPRPDRRPRPRPPTVAGTADQGAWRGKGRGDTGPARLDTDRDSTTRRRLDRAALVEPVAADRRLDVLADLDPARRRTGQRNYHDLRRGAGRVENLTGGTNDAECVQGYGNRDPSP